MKNDFQLKQYPDYEKLSEAAARFIIENVISTPDLLLCPATGSSPERAYELLTTLTNNVIFEKIKIIKLDEWGGISGNHPASCQHYLQARLIHPLGISSFTGFNPENDNDSEEIKKVTNYLTLNGPIDLCILGIGVNGHLGFNEPGDFLNPHAHKVNLTPESLNHPMIANLEDKPSFGLTLGMSDILQSRKILLLVNGKHKRNILQQLMKKQVSTQLPASFLWLHQDVTCLCDREAWDG